MKVELLNRNEVKELFSHWGKTSCVCYDTKISNPSIVGKHCLNSGHFSGSRSRYFEFLVTDVPRFTIDQVVRHEVGVCKNVQSFRYVNKDSFSYEIPTEITDCKELLYDYNEHMKNTIELYSNIQKYVYSKTNSNERANEQARYVLPMSTHSSFIIGFTIEALINLMHKRLCVRTEDVFRELAVIIRDTVLEVLPNLETELVPQCEYLTWCPESNGCGRFKSKEK